MTVRFFFFFALTTYVGDLAYGQPTWRRTYGSYGADDAACVKVTAEEDYLVVGSTGSFGAGSSDLYLLKLDGNGDVIWTRTIGTPQIDKGTSMCVASDGSIMIAGFSNAGGLGGYDGWLVKTDSEGQLLWQRYYGGLEWDFLFDIQPLDNGDWLLSGSTYSAGNGASDGWLLEVNMDGDIIWNRTYGGALEDELRSGKQTSDGGLIVAGTIAIGDTSDALVLRLDAEGDPVWERHFGGDSADVAVDIVETIDAGFSVVGSTRSFSPWTEHLHFKLSAAGDSLWTWNYGQVNDQEAMEHLELPTGEFVTVGYTKTSGGGAKDLFALLSAPDGAFLVQHSYGGTEDEVGYSVAEVANGFVLCGTQVSAPSVGGVDVFVVRCDSVVDTETELVTAYFDTTAMETVVGLKEHEIPSVRVFPNPAMDRVALFAEVSLQSVRLFDTQGRPVRSWPGPVNHELDLQGLATGAYELIAWDERGRRSVQTLVISAP